MKKFFTIFVLALLLAARIGGRALADTPTPTETQTETPAPLAGKTVVIDAGHGYNDSREVYYGGSYSWPGAAQYIEANRVLALAEETKRLLEEQGATVILTRETRAMVGSYARMCMMNTIALQFLRAQTVNPPAELLAELEYLTNILRGIIDEYDPVTDNNGPGAELYFDTPYDNTLKRKAHPDMKRIFDHSRKVKDLIFISIHTNATTASPTQTNGTVTYYMDNKFNKNYYSSYREKENARLANLLLQYVSTQTGLSNTGKNAVNDYFMIRELNVPAALIEVGFHTNWGDHRIMTDPAFSRKFAQGVLLAVLEFYNP
ncbi:MAG: N-acetylmuramoyl-L-alanine amidase [Clostridiales bacterium]|nr:N-acetylmuramoyl-L-alanine amidase [Clostridiales bacterium]